MNNFKDIHIGSLINQAVTESGIEISRICNFLNCTENDVLEMYQKESLDTIVLLRWGKLLEYDFFRVYSQHMILYAPPSSGEKAKNQREKKSSLPKFRKNIYTGELINFILELLETGQKTKLQIIEEYKIPKTTLYKWISKYSGKTESS
ncbi:transposase [Chryseobacterium oncorhynchi]|uniref:Transposase n=1 Tax=Chryseobacterium oncorhynchi TaxID=741074 RepID=A0A316WF64_9FLAO|nr:transposase [Chryseobacterium oncorhynchi]PWN60061.1 transposase [Chryseobacterium oncorhynchi]